MKHKTCSLPSCPTFSEKTSLWQSTTERAIVHKKASKAQSSKSVFANLCLVYYLPAYLVVKKHFIASMYKVDSYGDWLSVQTCNLNKHLTNFSLCRIQLLHEQSCDVYVVNLRCYLQTSTSVDLSIRSSWVE